MEHVSDDRRRSSSRLPGLRDTRRQADDIVEPNSRTSSLMGEEGAVSAAGASGALKPRRSLSSTTLHCQRLLCCTPGTGGGRSLEFVRKLSRSRGCLHVAPDSEARHGPRVLATNAKGSISSGATKAGISSVSTEAESVKSILSSQAVRLMEELLKPPNLHRAQSQQALPGAEKSTPASPKPSAVGAEALYIFSSSHRHTACYMYRTEKGDSLNVYGFEHVPVRAIHGCGGQPAYLMAMSDKDPTVDSLRYKCTFPASEAEASLARASSTAKAPPDGRSEAGGCDFGGKAEPASHVGGCVPQFIQQDMVQAVIDKVRNQLRNTNRRLDSFAHGDARNKAARDDIFYLVSDKDIVDFVGLALAELEHAGDATPSRRISARDARTLSSSPSLPKLNSQCNMITPCLAAAADPATTISVPKASFSNSGGADGGGRASIRCPDASTKATVVSRRSATEIVWRENEADSRQYATKRASGTDPGLVCKGHSSPLGELSLANGPPIRDCPPSNATTSARSSLAGRGVNMTSFPELQPRHCTNEWLKPPVEMDQLSKACPPDFYRMGVDAHGGAGASDSWSGGLAQEEPVVNALHCDHSLFGENPFYGDGDGDGLLAERQPTRRPSSITADKRLGTWIGSASHRRRSTQAADTRSWLGESANSDNNTGLLPSFLDRLRWNGQSIFHRHDDCPAPPTPPPTTPESPARGIRKTGAKGGGRRCDTCSEDNRPHVCVDDLDSTSGGVSSTG